MYIEETDCCALVHLQGNFVNEETTAKDIKYRIKSTYDGFLDYLNDNDNSDPTDNYAENYPMNVMCIITPHEKDMGYGKILEEVGFEKLTTMKRKPIYGGELDMYLLRLEEFFKNNK